MPGFDPVDPKQSFPELEERVLERWRATDVFGRSLAQRAEAPVWSLFALVGASMTAFGLAVAAAVYLTSWGSEPQ